MGEALFHSGKTAMVASLHTAGDLLAFHPFLLCFLLQAFHHELRRPIWVTEGISSSDTAACTFDRAVCRQNLDHVFRYSQVLNDRHRSELKDFLREKIREFDLSLPSYSMDFSPELPDHTPVRREITWWRDFSAGI